MSVKCALRCGWAAAVPPLAQRSVSGFEALTATEAELRLAFEADRKTVGPAGRRLEGSASPHGRSRELKVYAEVCLPGNHPVILLYIPRGLASEISPIHRYYFRPRGLQSFRP